MKWAILAMNKDREYIRVGSVESITYTEASYQAYWMEANEKLPELDFDWLTLWVVQDTKENKRLYKTKE